MQGVLSNVKLVSLEESLKMNKQVELTETIQLWMTMPLLFRKDGVEKISLKILVSE